MAAALVSVMMPAYNAERYIGGAIESVLRQEYPHWELLVVDDGSTDGTGGVARSFTDSRIKVMRKENGGESSARNAALDASAGEYIAYLDADDEYLPHHLTALVGYLDAHPDRDAVYADGYHIDQDGRRLATLQSRRRGPFEGRIYEEVVRASDVFGPPMAVVLRHEVVRRCRLRYDPRIVIGPDWDFFVRYSDVGTFGYLDTQTGLYRVHQNNITSKVGSQKRAGYLATCRENAIKMPSFAACSVETRAAVFYDLMVTLLRGQPGRRNAVAAWPEFAALPSAEQSRLLRLTATSALVADADQTHVSEWIRRARALQPGDWRAVLLAGLHASSPALCRRALGLMAPYRGEPTVGAPFEDLQPRSGHGSGAAGTAVGG